MQYKSHFHGIGAGLAAAGALSLMASSPAAADAPCGGGEIDECRVLIEINATDGDIGLQGLLDADGWQKARIFDTTGERILKIEPLADLADQNLAETFFESDEPLCRQDPERPDARVVSLSDFLERFPAGAYEFRADLPDGGQVTGTTELTHALPAAPTAVQFDGSRISWQDGSDLGACTPQGEGEDDGVDVALAADDRIAAYQVVLEPEVDSDDPAENERTRRTFSAVVPATTNAVNVPAQYLEGLPDDTPAKVEVVAIERRPNGSFGNQTAAEAAGLCINEAAGCPGPGGGAGDDGNGDDDNGGDDNGGDDDSGGDDDGGNDDDSDDGNDDDGDNG